MLWRTAFTVLCLGLVPAVGHDTFSWAHVSSDQPGLLSVGGRLSLGQKPLTALVEERDVSGNLVSLTPYVDGRRQGTAHRWFPDGSLHSSRRYVDGSKDGPQIGYWPNGTLRFRYLAEGGAYAGKYESWHPNGQLGALGHFESGKEKGTQKTWDQNGRLLSNYVVKDGRRYGLLDAKPCFTVREGGFE